MKAYIEEQLQAVRKVTDFVPRVALTLGSGLGGFAKDLDVVATVPYKDIPGFPVSTAPGHVGQFVFAKVNDVPIVCMQGRVHFYEGYTMEQVVNPVRLMAAMGVETLFLTNAAGGAKDGYHAGDLALVTDHISLFIQNPLLGPNDDSEGVRFPDMTHVYDEGLQKIIKEAATENDIDLKTGVYVQLTGPSYETPAEIRLIRSLGGDLVGMSTVVEAITARHLGLKVCCVSLVSNLAAGISPTPLTEQEVIDAGNAAAPKFSALVKSAISRM